MVTTPAYRPVTMPVAESTLAYEGFDELQVPPVVVSLKVVV
jgi:hypothetical protein